LEKISKTEVDPKTGQVILHSVQKCEPAGVGQPLIMEEVVWPEYRKYASILHKLTEEISSDLISKIHLVEDDEETIIIGEIATMPEQNR
jgi:hypothetical protein